MATYKSTHTSEDGKQRVCSTTPDRCPLKTSNEPVPHTVTLDGEVLTETQITQINTLFELYQPILHPHPASNQNHAQKINQFINENLEPDPYNEGQFRLHFESDVEYKKFLKGLYQKNSTPEEVIYNTYMGMGGSSYFSTKFLTKENIKKITDDLTEYVENGTPLELAMALVLPQNQHLLKAREMDTLFSKIIQNTNS